MGKKFSGVTAETPKHLLLDAGAFYKNYDFTKTPDLNATALIGATQGGGSFSAVPTVRKIEIDGVKGSAKGTSVIDDWAVTMVINVKEVTAKSLVLALGAASSAASTQTGLTGYTEIKPRNEFLDADYADNIVWVGRLSGAPNDPVIIVLKNALSTNGLSLTMADKAEGVIAITLTGHYGLEDSETPPFAIYYPTVA